MNDLNFSPSHGTLNTCYRRGWFNISRKFVYVILKPWQRGRLEEQVRQHNERRAIAISEMNSEEREKKSDDNLYEVTLDEDFITALEYGMPPASGMVWSSNCFFY